MAETTANLLIGIHSVASALANSPGQIKLIMVAEECHNPRVKKLLQQAGLEPLSLVAKEGLALLNGTQVSTALALCAVFRAENILAAALTAGAMSADAIKGSDTPFDERIHVARGHRGQMDVARVLRALMYNSEIRASHVDCGRVQDPYSIRCQPQVVGACLDVLRHVSSVLEIEANAVTDNPLIFAESEAVLSGGNFHAEPVAFAADYLALARSQRSALCRNGASRC